MVVIDTSAWIEWLSDSPTAQRFEADWPAVVDTLVPTLVKLELAKWLRRETSEQAVGQALAYLESCLAIDLNTRIAPRAAEVSPVTKLATADAVIYATALEWGAEVLTCDRHFEGLAGVRYVAKDAAPQAGVTGTPPPRSS